MLLAMDVGNTETVIGLFGPETPETPDAMGFARATTSADWPFTGGSRRSRSARRTSTRWCSPNCSISRASTCVRP